MNYGPGSAALRLTLTLGIACSAVPAVAQAGDRSSPGMEAAIGSASRSDRDLRAFYAARGNRPLWFYGLASRVAAGELIRLIEDADVDGLDSGDFDVRSLADAIARSEEGSPKQIAKAEITFSRAFVRYARALRRPRNVGTVYLDEELAPNLPSSSALLKTAASARSLRDHVVDMRWMNPLYADLRQGLLANRDDTGGGSHSPVPDGATLKLGMNDGRVSYLRQRLGLPMGGPYDRDVAAAVAEFQEGRGLPVDGVAGPRTILALNDDPSDKSGLIRTNLERARVLPTDPGRRHILVDAAGARMWLYENGRAVDTMKVIVGRPVEQTPMLAGLMHYAIVNPYWNIPPDLARNRVAPEVLRLGTGYMKRMRYEVLSDWSSSARVVDPRTVDWAAVAAGSQEIRVRQLPGKANSMGRVKFVLPNNLGIYLHDTPDKHLFKAADRHLSAGCVRVEDAARLSKWLFGKPLVATGNTPEQRVDLPEPVPVYLTYLTAAPAARGLVFNADRYGRDQGPTRMSSRARLGGERP